VASWDWNIVHSHLTLMATAHVVSLLFRREAKNVDRPRWVLLERERLQNQVILRLGASHRKLNVNELVDNLARDLEKIWISLFANLAFKGSPVHTQKSFRFFLLKLRWQPIAKALKMYEPHAAFAFARYYARVLLSRLWAPTESAG
jgi:hypothetical protein